MSEVEELELIDGTTTEAMKLLKIIAESGLIKELHYTNVDKKLSLKVTDTDDYSYLFERWES